MGKEGKEMNVEKSWVEDGALFIQVSCDDRETLTRGIRQFAVNFMTEPENKLGAWVNGGVEKIECPIAYDPARPDMDPMEIVRAEPNKVHQWRYSQVIKVTKGI